MADFPQLSTGAVSQYPLTRNVVTRTVTNSLEDGSTIRLADPVYKIRWDLSYTGLSQNEWNALAAFFASMQGQLNAFIFVDPAANLLSWSEDLSHTVWVKDGLIQTTAGIADPLQGTSATLVTNTAQIAQGVSQQINAPGSYSYCFSVYLRCDQACSVTLRCFANGVEQDEQDLIDSEWSRYTLSVALSSPIEGVTFGLLFPAGVAVDVFGLQVEAQPAAGIYKKVTGAGAVYVHSRFAQDELPFSIDSFGLYSAKLSILTNILPA